jgi:hypothetical protein
MFDDEEGALSEMILVTLSFANVLWSDEIVRSQEEKMSGIKLFRRKRERERKRREKNNYCSSSQQSMIDTPTSRCVC